MASSRKFYELTARERLQILQNEQLLTDDDFAQLADVHYHGILDPDVASHLIENQISQYALPFAVARGLIVNGKTYTVPMVVEEASVVAAASNGARMVARAGSNGVTASSQPHRVLGEIVFESSDINADRAQEIIVSRETLIFDTARKALPTMHARGGGLESTYVEMTPDGSFTKIILVINPCDAMGANAVNTIAEALRPLFEECFSATALVAILSNAGDVSVTVAEVELDPEDIAFKNLDSQLLAQRIALLSRLSQSDYQRAVTHNKGIMNGISSAVLATGNDTRAVEACAHAYASRSGTYQPLTQWTMNDAGKLCGRIEIPLQVGIVGGSASSLDIAKIARRIGGYTSVNEFKNVLAALGLVQNLSAMRALAGPGIQAGHMSLQMNALSIAAGAQGDEIGVVAGRLRELPAQGRTKAQARAIIAQLRNAQSHV